MITEVEAIHSLIPNTEWHYSAGVLTVFTEGVETPTAQEIQNELIKLQAAEAAAKAEALAKRQALLDRLGITEEEARLLLA